MHRPRRALSHTATDMLLLAVAAACVAVIYQLAGDFYGLSGDAQLDHPMYERWRSAGLVGRVLGTAAVVMFFLNLLYLARRRLRSWHKFGRLKLWMSGHVFFGLLGGGLLLLHAVFGMSSEAAGLSAKAVIALLITGVIGRYVYALVPHTATGEEDPAGIHGRAEAALGRLRGLIGVDHPMVLEVRERARLEAREGGLRGVGLLLVGWLLPAVRRWRTARWLKHHGIVEEQRDEVRAAVLDVLLLGYQLAVAGTAKWLLRRWRIVHLFAALLMVWTAYRHIASAFATGYGWKIPGSGVPWALGGLAVVGAVLGWESLWRRRARRRKVRVKTDLGPVPEPPPTLHPYIDPGRCMGSAACVSACPEGDILALLDGRSRLAEPSHCIGHGACAANCPVEAITLVFGSLKRGVDIPDVSPRYESSVSGIYMAGELTGMGLIRNAVEQASQAVGFLAHARSKDSTPLPEDMLDLLIIGAGPAGLAASLAAQERGLRYLTVEQEPDIGGAIRHYPRRKLVMTAPMHLPLHGPVKFRHVAKEELVELFQTVRERHQPAIEFGVRIDGMTPVPQQGFAVTGGGKTWLARRVLLCLGRRGTPLRLGVPGEDSAHVVYNLVDADVYRGRTVAVVGGGDSALEAAIAVAEAGATAVHVIHRRDGFDRAKAANRERLQALVDAGRITVHYKAAIERIGAHGLVLAGGARLEVTDVIVSVGGTLPTALLKAAGVRTQTHFGRPIHLAA